MPLTLSVERSVVYWELDLNSWVVIIKACSGSDFNMDPGYIGNTGREV